MRRRTVVVNSVLGVALVAVATTTVVAVAGGRPDPAPTGATVAVVRGTVTSTVTATGNVEAGSTVSVDSSASGKVTKLYVKKGQQVAKGDKLLKIDDTSARQSLATARANLASAEASMTTTLQGRSAQDQAVDSAGVRSAQTALTNARTALSQAGSSRDLDRKQQAKLVSRAEDSLQEAKDQKSDDEADLRKAQQALTTAQQAGDTAGATAQRTKITQLQTAIGTDASAVESASASLLQSKQTRDKTLLADKQNVQTQEGQVATAKDSLASQQAQQASNSQPARQGAVDSAQAQIDSSQVSVDQAEKSLADTTVRAPVAGTVADITAVVGQSSSSAGASSTSGSTAAGASGTSAASGTSTGSASSGSGLVTLVAARTKQVTAAVAEADIVKVKSGQSVSVVFPASAKTLKGLVTSVATESTVSNNVVQYDVAVSLPTASSSIRLGQTADVTITTATHRDTLYVPSSAITTSGATTTVTRRMAGVDSLVQVEPGLVGANGTEIVRGLSEGDLLVLPTGNASGGLTFPGASSGSSSPSASASRSSR